MPNAYEERDKLLATMGYPTYADYLKSGLWEWIKSQLAGLDWRKCTWCNSKAGLVWHHTRYDLPTLCGNISFPDHNTRTERDELGKWPPFVRLCSDCHTRAHYDNGEFITNLDRVNHRIALRSEDDTEKRKFE